jgi:CheY-like chemotaxis protein
VTKSIGVDRRLHVRVIANGSAIVHGDATTRGRLLNISSGGMLMRLGDGEPDYRCGEHVKVEVHLDRARATWLRFHGEIARAGDRELAICFTAIPSDFADVIQDALVSALEGAALAHVLLVDANAERRSGFAALLRRAGCRVAEVATPLEAIAHLGGSAIHSWVVAISSTVPQSTADELQRFLAQSEAQIEVRMLGSKSPTSALAWFTATARLPS